jgi:DNA-binding transcriptional LysR family regulator
VHALVPRQASLEMLLGLVAAGAGVTLVPALAARRPPERVCLLRPAEPVTRQVFTVSRRGGDRKPAVRVVLDALAAAAAIPHTEFLLTG